MKTQRLNVIREVLTSNPVASQDELRRKLRRRGIHVTQATLSRDMHELQLFKGPRRILASQWQRRKVRVLQWRKTMSRRRCLK